MGKRKTYSTLWSDTSKSTKTCGGTEWVEARLMTSDVKLIAQMDKDGVTYLHLKEVHDASGDLPIRSFKLLADGTMIPLDG